MFIADVEKLAMPLLTVAVPKRVVPSMNSTVPVGGTLVNLIIETVNVTEVPKVGSRFDELK